MKRIASLALIAVTAFSAFAADLSIDWRKDVSAYNPAMDYFSFKGKKGSVEKDRFDPKKKVNAVTGASKSGSTKAFDAYRLDDQGKSAMPAALRNLFLFSVAADSVRSDDALTAVKAKDGAITIRFVHRGSAYEIVTDAQGKLRLPSASIRTRKIGHADNTIHADFSPTGKADAVSWEKVWDASIADGKEVKSADGKALSKTGKILPDKAASADFAWTGELRFTLDGTILKATAELDAVKL